ncbi:g10748 [Coccomyxa elongata]
MDTHFESANAASTEASYAPQAHGFIEYVYIQLRSGLPNGAALVALGHGVHSGIKLAKGCQRIADDELRALVRVNYTHNGGAYKETFVIRKAKYQSTLKIFKVETKSLIFHKEMGTTYTWTTHGSYQKIDCTACTWSGFALKVASSGLVSGDLQQKCLRMRIGELIMLMAASLPARWTGLVAELGANGLMETKCDNSLAHDMLTGKMSIRYFQELSPIMEEYVDVF